ncbi:MAG: DNA polymerase/3'-5' exonuclease PolX, partial [Anoxybacillus ayderensis]|nr:DNA polymerase/3'-5' exonuclease PolX [Anoxybacillus ayderensis]
MEKSKKEAIRLLETIALYMEIKGENPFKVSAFRKAALALERDERALTHIADFTSIAGIGKGTAAVLQQWLQTGTSDVLEQLKKEIPEGLFPLLKLPGLGGKKIAKLYHELRVTDIETLKEACLAQRVRQLSGFGAKTEENILAALANLHARPERLPIAFMLEVALDVERQLAKMEGIVQFSRAGSLRRVCETIKDLDFIIATNDHSLVREQLLQLEHIHDVVANGDTKVSLQLKYE